MSERYFERGSNRQYKPHLPMEAFEADRRMNENLVSGSRKLLEALMSGYGRDQFSWSKADGGANWQPTEATGKWAYRVDLCQLKLDHADALRRYRDPCSCCGTRSDIGGGCSRCS